MSEMVVRDRIQFDEDDSESIDEVVVTGGFAHLERMHSRGYYLGLHRPDGTSLAIWLCADKKGRISATYEEREAPKRALAALQGTPST